MLSGKVSFLSVGNVEINWFLERSSVKGVVKRRFYRESTHLPVRPAQFADFAWRDRQEAVFHGGADGVGGALAGAHRDRFGSITGDH